MKWVRDDIKDLKAYKPNNSSYSVKLDANEGANLFLQVFENMDMSFLKDINRYPASNAEDLREEISKYISVDPANIIVGNGSSEMIELVMKTFIEEGDKILSFVPTFSMYNIYSQIYKAEFLGIEGKEVFNETGELESSMIREDFSLDIDRLIKKAKDIRPKIILVCNPNNPTGYLMLKEDIKKLLKNTDSLVVVDEAYIEFAEGSMLDEIDHYDNLIVLRTLSKALGLAGIRLGYMLGNIDLINWVNKIKSPYNLNAFTQAFAIEAIKNIHIIEAYMEEVKAERKSLYKELEKLGIKVYESYTNFILFYLDIENLGKKLQEAGVLIRDFSGELENYYRVTVGNKFENKFFLDLLKEIIKDEKS